MNDSFNDSFKKLINMLKGDTPQEVNNILNDLGISKNEAIDSINKIDKDTLKNTVNSKEFADFIKNISQEDINKIKNVRQKDELEELYKSFLKGKGGN